MKVIMLFVLTGWLLLARTEGHSNNVFLHDVEHPHDDADHVEEKQAATQATTAPTTVKVEQPVKITPTTTNDKVNTPTSASTASKDNTKKVEEKQQTKTTTSETKGKEPTPVAAGTVSKSNDEKKVEEKQPTETSSPADNVKVAAPFTESTATKTEATVVKPKEPVADATVKGVEAGKDGDGKKNNDIDAKDIPITQKVEDKKATVATQNANPGTPVVEDVDVDDDDDEEDDDEDDDDDDEVEGTAKEVKKNATTEAGVGQGSEKIKTESSGKDVEDKIEENLNDISKGKDKFFIVWSDEGEWDSPDFQGDEGHIEEVGKEDSMKNSKSYGAVDGVSKGDEVGDDEDNYASIDKAKGIVHDGKDIKGTESGGSGPGDKEKVAAAGTSKSGKSEKTDEADVKIISEGGIEGAGKGPLHEDDEDDFDDEDDIEEVIKDEVNVKGETKKSESLEKDEEGVCVKKVDGEDCGTDSNEDSWFKWLFGWLD